MEILKEKIIALIFLSFIILSQISGQELKFKLGDSNYNGKVKSVSIFEHHRLDDEKVVIPLTQAPKTYEEFNEIGRLIYRISNSASSSYFTRNDYDDLGNIQYQMQHKFPYTKERDAFLKKKIIFNKKTGLLLDSLKQYRLLKETDDILEVEKFYYDYQDLSIIRISKKYLEPTLWKVDEYGNIIYQESYIMKHNSSEKQIVERKYLEDKIIHEVYSTPENKVYRQFLYDEKENLSNQMMFNKQAVLLKHHIHIYSENKEIMKIFDGKNKLVSEMTKESSPELITYIYSKIDEKGDTQIIKKETEYTDGFGNVIKREVENIGYNRIYITEYVFKYYQ